MSDPVPAIAEASATGAVAEIFADIRRVLVHRINHSVPSAVEHPPCSDCKAGVGKGLT